jgi:hypothetical protein
MCFKICSMCLRLLVEHRRKSSGVVVTRCCIVNYLHGTEDILLYILLFCLALYIQSVQYKYNKNNKQKIPNTVIILYVILMFNISLLQQIDVT